MAHVGLCFSRKMVRRTPPTPFHDHNGLTIQEEGKRRGKKDITDIARLRGEGASGKCT